MLSAATTVAAIGLTWKGYLHSGLCSTLVRGLPYLLEALNCPERQNRRDVVTGERYYLAELTNAEYCTNWLPKSNSPSLDVRYHWVAVVAKRLTLSQARRPSYMGHSPRADVPTLPLNALDPQRIRNHIY